MRGNSYLLLLDSSDTIFLVISLFDMNLLEDEPRNHPKPVPFCHNALLHPTVPEVSLLLQENFDSQKAEKKTDSFSGTEFQTYNSWKWKHMNQNNTNHASFDFTKVNKPNNNENHYLIKDKYFTSDLEKRKNEILYGEPEEPRRPLPPRTNPVIPKCVEFFFSNSSFDDSKSVCSIQRNLELQNLISSEDVILKSTNENFCKKELHSSEKFCSIISEQNKQMEVLQNQLQQLLKLQEVKDKQVEQLLNCQESKEKKIEQLLQLLEVKDKEIEQLKYSKEKQEQKVQELLKSQENIQKENLNLLTKLNSLSQKDMHTVGVMACVQLNDASTYIDSDDILREYNIKKTENTTESISVIRESNKFDERDKSLSLHSSDLPVIQENAFSPQSSIHLDIQDFPDSSDESEAGIPSSNLTASKETQSNPLGCTFYNNVLTQLKGIIQNSGEKEKEKEKDDIPNVNLENEKKVPKQPITECSFIRENKEPTYSFHAFNLFDKKTGTSILSDQRQTERYSEKLQNFCIKDTKSPSDISLKINALALKYLKQEQISELDLQTQIPACQHDVTIYNVTNLSFGSVRYLDRYQMLPKVKESQKHINKIQKHELSPAEFLHRRKRMTIEENITSTIGNILDISTLNQQPKLL